MRLRSVITTIVPCSVVLESPGRVLLITGDKNLLEAGVESPEIIKPADYLARPTRTL